jgi:gliding motility-associated-like protein
MNLYSRNINHPRMKKICLFILLSFISFSKLAASHIVGGEFQLKLKRGFNYTLSLRMYFDDIHAEAGLLADDQSIHVAIYEKTTNQLIKVISLPRISENLINYKYNQCTEFNSNKVRTRLLFYSLDIFLDPDIFNSPNGYYVVWERCCRNAAIVNIQDPGDVGNAFYLEFPAVVLNGQRFINTSPVFNDITGDFPCINQPFSFPFGAYDPDGDSLTYRLVTPFAGHSNLSPFGSSEPDPPFPAPYPNISWAPGYGINNEIPGSPALTIDKNGNLLVRPNQLGIFAISIECNEYRNGVKIGTVRRDFQFPVINCPYNYPPQLEMKIPGQAGYYNKKDTLSLTIGESVCYNLLMTDSTYNIFHQNKDLFLDLTNSDLPPNVYSLSISSGTLRPGNDTLKSDLCIITCGKFPKNKDQLYYIHVIVRDNGCPLPRLDSIRIPLLIKHLSNDTPSIKIVPPVRNANLLVGNSINFNVIGTDKDHNDFLNLSAYGDGFNLSDVGMIFSNVSGQDSISSPFRWTADCIAFKQRQNFKVIFQIVDNSCLPENKDTISVNLNLKDNESDLGNLSPPNLITPNNDGHNDYFEIPNIPPDNCEFFLRKIEVYNRWGAKVYEAKTRNFRWDPSKDSDGMYFYMIDLNQKQVKGWVQVIR